MSKEKIKMSKYMVVNSDALYALLQAIKNKWSYEDILEIWDEKRGKDEIGFITDEEMVVLLSAYHRKIKALN